MTQPAFDFGDEALDDPANPTFTVSELADAVNGALRRGFSDGVWVRGEIQGWNERGGHPVSTSKASQGTFAYTPPIATGASSRRTSSPRLASGGMASGTTFKR